jgi:Putative transmembrane protein (PGPGW)
MDRLTAQARKAVTISIGIVLLVVGVALLILPGPGLPLIIVGLTLLSAHFVWAQRLRARVVDLAKQGLGWAKRAGSAIGIRTGTSAERPPP